MPSAGEMASAAASQPVGLQPSQFGRRRTVDERPELFDDAPPVGSSHEPVEDGTHAPGNAVQDDEGGRQVKRTYERTVRATRVEGATQGFRGVLPSKRERFVPHHRQVEVAEPVGDLGSSRLSWASGPPPPMKGASGQGVVVARFAPKEEARVRFPFAAPAILRICDRGCWV